jgi:hypothetical protein
MIYLVYAESGYLCAAFSSEQLAQDYVREWTSSPRIEPMEVDSEVRVQRLPAYMCLVDVSNGTVVSKSELGIIPTKLSRTQVAVSPSYIEAISFISMEDAVEAAQREYGKLTALQQTGESP